MKQIFIILALFATLSFSACSDFLVEDVRGQENLDTYFQSENDAESFLTGCYNAITYHGWWQVENFWILTDMCSDDLWMGNTTQDQSGYISLAHYQGVGQSNGTISNFWQYRYKGILRCNIAIERIPEAPIRDERKKERFIAEAKFLRAYFYFELVKNFGDVPIIQGFLLPEEVSGITRSSTENVYALIEQDLTDAANVLPQRSEYGADDMGRATRGAALGMLGKAFLYQNKFAEARDILKTVINEGEYKLMTDFGDVWSIDAENNEESLFEVQNMYDETYELGGSLSIVTGNRSGGDQDGWAWGLPTANLENAFIEAGDTERLRWTIIKHGATEIAGENQFDQLITAQGNQNGDGTYCIDPAKHKSARVNRKFWLPFTKRPANYNQPRVPLNHRILRYADILLMYAEACNETGDDATARNALNQVRDRVNLGAVTLSGNELRNAIRAERRLELACENHRLYDIRRWTDDNGKKMIANIMGVNGSFVQWNTSETTADPYEWENQYEPSNKGITFNENRDLLFPIPLYEITMSNGSITQNPGWN
ncbi:RagB/SusD family nutrient uptake outer membrane protein [Proteiniphilum sp. X52]|uniref:RagB/SusD family nutrient uptake outer membrane protein n=1 Tax=Proteiniphilum sp. X52 TaxID=2382159 RepID=UPI000F09A955|nr:RagB/SusD family nutrient uptake outer membrane protein [Proteiniphilum sp. X52]RNC65991.1 RagB/SusD family nutrient uptake outer membrane protein [Proteiniphilum sp. X52]